MNLPVKPCCSYLGFFLFPWSGRNEWEITLCVEGVGYYCQRPVNASESEMSFKQAALHSFRRTQSLKRAWIYWKKARCKLEDALPWSLDGLLWTRAASVCVDLTDNFGGTKRFLGKFQMYHFVKLTSHRQRISLCLQTSRFVLQLEV